MQSILRVILFFGGLWLLVFTFYSIVRTFVVPRNEKVLLVRIVFKSIRFLFDLMLMPSNSFFYWDRVLALYAPLCLLALSVTGIGLMWISYFAMFTGFGIPWNSALTVSGSFLLTLGAANNHSLWVNVLGFSESVFGLLMIAMLVSFLPTIYSAFSKREVMVTRLEYRAGSPPSGVEIVARLHRLGEVGHLNQLWSTWENWFVEVEESHTSLFALAFFRSPKPQHSWVNAAGAILDAASLVSSTVDQDLNYQTEMCLQAGIASLLSIADFFDLSKNLPAENKNETENETEGNLSISYEQYKLACLKLSIQGVPLKQDTVRAWADFQKSRGLYDAALLGLAKWTVAPETTWSYTRPKIRHSPFLAKVGLHPTDDD